MMRWRLALHLPPDEAACEPSLLSVFESAELTCPFPARRSAGLGNLLNSYGVSLRFTFAGIAEIRTPLFNLRFGLTGPVPADKAPNPSFPP